MRIYSKINYEVALTPFEMISVTLPDATVVKVDRITVRHNNSGVLVIRYSGWYKPDVNADTKPYTSSMMGVRRVPPELVPLLNRLDGGTVVDQYLENFLAGQGDGIMLGQ